MNQINTTDPAEMDHNELRSEWHDCAEKLQRPLASHELENAIWDRKKALWDEMKSRVDAEPPKCPECGAQSWSQTMGEPKVCMECDLHIGLEYEELGQRIDDYWNKVRSGGSQT